LLDLNNEFWKTTKTAIQALEHKRKLNQNKMLGFRFLMQDRNAIITDQAKELEATRKELNAQNKSRLLLTIEVRPLRQSDIARFQLEIIRYSSGFSLHFHYCMSVPQCFQGEAFKI
jgi:hypothetical protein